MRELRLITAFWLMMVGCLILISLLFKLPGLALNSTVATGFEELLLLILVLTLNDRYIHQPLHLRSALSWPQQAQIVGPTLLVVAIITITSLIATTQLTSALTNLMVALLISLFEEVLFRGILFKRSLKIFGVTPSRLGRAVCLSSLYFSLTHLVNLSHQSIPLTLLQLGFTFALGLLLAGIYQATGTLIWPIVIHAANDFFSFSQPTINLPLIHTTASFQVLEIIIILALAGLVFRPLVAPNNPPSQ
ncbi:CPBP family intramembrane glutamic endopeptidase [Lactiplantibacillus plajomi]|uniref:Lysostaphin resistance A-like protein n=1 Tax=Lactiplantibacillus plajomi TaxID=1457217 RepID=A0ABV6K288_9LACO|nr:CPBP family intramembrane glutamic endopeptidase [Lactiplantibacillus plajomi]